MPKIMAMCDAHKVGIAPHSTGPVGTAAHIHFLTSFSAQVVMEYNNGATMPSHLTEAVAVLSTFAHTARTQELPEIGALIRKPSENRWGRFLHDLRP